MVIPLVFLAAAAGAAWLSVGDRVSPLALTVVEWETSLGFPIWIPLAAVGAALALVEVARRRTPAATSSPGPSPRQTRPTLESQRRAALAPQAEPGPGWRAAVDAQALRLPLGPQGRVKLDEAVDVPLTLVLRDATPQQAKHRYGEFARFLATIPTPPAARVRLESCPLLEGQIHKAFGAELAQVFDSGRFHVVSCPDGVDVRFAQPDPRWTAH